MKKAIIVLALSFSCFIILQAQENPSTSNHHLGIRVSSKDAVVNHAVAYKYFFNRSLAAEALFSFVDPAAIGLLIEKHTALGSRAGVSWFWGAGPYFGFGSQRRFGVHGVAGLDFLFPSLPLNISIDWKPEFNITKKFSVEPAAAGLSVRFVF